jgi:CheY-like chemotaxis protein
MIQSISTEAQIQDLVVEGENAAMRARELTNQLLTFAKGGLPIRKPISITRLLRETVGFTLRGSKVGYTLAAPDDLWLVDIDEGQIGQVIGNLVINADQAMPGGGTIRIECRNHAVVEDNSLPLAPGRYVEVAIADEGTGIPDGLLPRIFDPFFTTKQKGSGLGLSTSFSIVKLHDGHITVSSVLGRGSTFSVFLPASAARPSDRPAVAVPPPTSRPVKVLVMDDDPTVREVVERMLTVLGCTVEVTRHGAEAIERITEARLAGEQYDVVFLDLTVPGGMGGMEAVARLRQIDGAVKVVASSGYSTDAVMSDFRAHGFDAALPKPYNMKMLKELLATVLGGE